VAPARRALRRNGVDTTAEDSRIAHIRTEPTIARGYRSVQATDCWGTRRAYVPRQPERAVLHQVVREHLETFLAEARHRGGGEGLPLFVEREFREFLTCGVLARGFARFRCHGCLREILVAFSCCPQLETICSSRSRAGLNPT